MLELVAAGRLWKEVITIAKNQTQTPQAEAAEALIEELNAADPEVEQDIVEDEDAAIAALIAEDEATAAAEADPETDEDEAEDEDEEVEGITLDVLRGVEQLMAKAAAGLDAIEAIHEAGGLSDNAYEEARDALIEANLNSQRAVLDLFPQFSDDDNPNGLKPRRDTQRVLGEVFRTKESQRRFVRALAAEAKLIAEEKQLDLRILRSQEGVVSIGGFPHRVDADGNWKWDSSIGTQSISVGPYSGKTDDED